ncbi:hypothetical protein D3C81_2043020 [compost metagenome]
MLGGVAQLLQVSQQPGPLLIVFQRLDHLVQRLPQRFRGLGLGLGRAAKQARQTDRMGGCHGQPHQQANQQCGRQGKQASEHGAVNLDR